MISFKDQIILDEIDSWPKEILFLLQKNEKILKGFLAEEERIDTLAINNLLLRLNRPENVHNEMWNKTMNGIENVLKLHSIVGIHCSKLFDWEIEDILTSGLNPLDREFANQRIEKAFNKGFLSKELRNELIDKEEFIEDNRKGNIFVFHCLKNLRSESGLNRLFGLWGGESIFANVKNSQELKNIGTPCIIFISVKIKELGFCPELSKRITAYYFNNNYFPYDTDSIINKNLKVLRVVRRNEKLFEDLTGIEMWDDDKY